MASIEDVFSLRLVIADFCMEKPILGLDPCYSEFRGQEIKRVPILRIFGPDTRGNKTCMHIHGVFPYFYIPYETKDFESVNKAIYQIATNVDKAINISLGQGSSSAQHVFKIQLVKGIPFYGYHRAEHQFLKIYMFNPRFIRRAANLLQNGAILGRVFHPHESHVPYVLQFMIDYNLYGMSLLHVPLDIVKFRRRDDEEVVNYPGIQISQLLSASKATKQSSSALEVDIVASFILNRFQLMTKSDNTHTNPGIESIWHDEKIRRLRAKMNLKDNEDNIPPLEVPATQERPNVQLSDSEIFYRTALLSKLAATDIVMGSQSDQTINSSELSNITDSLLNTTTHSNKKRTFNLKKLLANAVYPEECSQNMTLTNASTIENHLTKDNVMELTLSTPITDSDESVFLDKTILDDELIMSLTQQHVPLNATLRQEDFELLDVLEQLEEENVDKAHIDLDSSLAQLENHNNFEISPHLLDTEEAALVSNQIFSGNDSESDHDDDEANLNDFTMVVDDIDEVLLKLTQSQEGKRRDSATESKESVPQIDGSDDLLKTPTKSNRIESSLAKKTINSPRTPRTPKTRRSSIVGSSTFSPRTPKLSKYAPLPLTITNKSDKRLSLGSTKLTRSSINLNIEEDCLNLPDSSSAKPIHMLRKESNRGIDSIVEENSKKPIRRSRRIMNLDKTHITCSLTPGRSKIERKLKIYNTECNKITKVSNEQESTEISNGLGNELSHEKSSNIVNEIVAEQVDNLSEKCDEISKSSETINQNESVVNHSPILIDTPKAPDRENSDMKTDEEELIESDNELERLPGRKTPNLRRLRKRLHTNSKLTKTLVEHQFTNKVKEAVALKQNNEDEHNNKSVVISKRQRTRSTSQIENYNVSMLNSPSVFSDNSTQSPALSGRLCTPASGISDQNNMLSSPSSVIVTPLDLPPTYEEVLGSCEKFGITEYEFQKPFYNNPSDIRQKTEIGYTVLTIPGNKLNDCEEFCSLLGEDSLKSWRKKQLVNIGGPTMLNRFRNTQRIREYFCTDKKVIITPRFSAPNNHDAKLWLNARNLSKNKAEEKWNPEEESPVKITRRKVTMMLNEDTSDNENDEKDVSMNNLTLTPETPVKTQEKDIGKDETTPLRESSKRPDHKSKRNLENEDELKPSIKCVSSELLLEKKDLTNDVKTSLEKTQLISSDPSTSRLAFSSSAQHDVSFGLSSVTLNNTFGFKVNLENLQEAKADIEYHYLTTVALEVFIPTRDDLYPNPEVDEIRCIFYAIDNSIPPQNEQQEQAKSLPKQACGYIIVNDGKDIIDKEGKNHGIDSDVEVKVVASEIEALHALLELCSIWDPDIYAGYEIEMSSWGYIIERSKYLHLNISALLSRMPSQKVRDFVDEDRDQFTDLDIEMKLCGRILLDVWRLMRSEIALTSYTFENVMYHIMHRRCPWHSYRSLTNWFLSPCSRWIVIEYYLERVRGTLALLDQLDLIGRTSEMAKLIGIQFYEVLSRGSQFRVESMMLRIAKPKNLVPLSPSVQQRAHMRAPEYLALIMEPASRFYADPLIVLDFQSLYPSMIIAYNYCFSTCLGRVEHLGQSSPFEFGASQLRVSPTMLRHLLDKDLVTVSPCGVVFVKASVREGILPRMLSEILDTRQMVKQSMKLYKSNSALQRILHSRQLGLKLMANVTYGYTAANFSGRMPAVEVGDTVVSKGRETLESAIKMVEENTKWNVKVVYGDTDSMFVLVPGRSRAKAFEIGAEIAEAVTKANPIPVKLKLEKVYQPCILQTKKRYVGYMYETPDQTSPVYEAKGIETVRRDGCPAVAKMLEKVLRILFETTDVSQVKTYVCRQFTKLLSGRANLQDLIFAKEFRGLNGYKPNACVPALELTRKWMQNDPRRIPRRGERVPFIVTNGPPGVPLIRLVRSPHDVLADEGLKINAIYYITKAIIPPLNRCLLLIGADVNDWFANLPRKILTTPALSAANEVISLNNASHSKKSTISQYFSTTNCIIDCGRQTKDGICSECGKDPAKSISTVYNKIAKIERGYYLPYQICQACCGRIGDINCESLDCPVLYVLEVKRRDLSQILHLRNLLKDRI